MLYNINYINHYINDDPIMYWLNSNKNFNDYTEDPDNFFIKYLHEKKEEILENLYEHYKIEYNITSFKEQKFSIKHLLKYNKECIIFKPELKFLSFKFNDCLIIKKDNIIDLVVPTIKSCKKKIYDYIADLCYSSIEVDNVYFIFSNENYLDKNKYIRYERKMNFNELKEKLEYISNYIKKISKMNINDLYPNMKNHEDYPYHNCKKNIAQKCNEITQYYHCNTSLRKYYLKYNNGKEYNEKNFGIKKKNELRNLILEGKENKIKLKNVFENKKKVFIDFEFLPKIIYKTDNIEKIEYIEGVYNIGFVCDNKEYSIYTNEPNTLNILNELNDKLTNLCNSCEDLVIFHWSNAEILWIKKYKPELLDKYTFVDLYKIFINNKIIFKGMKNFKLKEVVRCLHKKIDNDIDCGEDTISLYLSDFINKTQLNKNKIIQYNILDCKYLQVIFDEIYN